MQQLNAVDAAAEGRGFLEAIRLVRAEDVRDGTERFDFARDFLFTEIPLKVIPLSKQ